MKKVVIITFDKFTDVVLVQWAVEKQYDEATSKDVIASVLPVGQGQVCIY